MAPIHDIPRRTYQEFLRVCIVPFLAESERVQGNTKLEDVLSAGFDRMSASGECKERLKKEIAEHRQKLQNMATPTLSYGDRMRVRMSADDLAELLETSENFTRTFVQEHVLPRYKAEEYWSQYRLELDDYSGLVRDIYSRSLSPGFLVSLEDTNKAAVVQHRPDTGTTSFLRGLMTGDFESPISNQPLSNTHATTTIQEATAAALKEIDTERPIVYPAMRIEPGHFTVGGIDLIARNRTEHLDSSSVHAAFGRGVVHPSVLRHLLEQEHPTSPQLFGTMRAVLQKSQSEWENYAHHLNILCQCGDSAHVKCNRLTGVEHLDAHTSFDLAQHDALDRARAWTVANLPPQETEI